MRRGWSGRGVFTRHPREGGDLQPARAAAPSRLTPEMPAFAGMTVGRGGMTVLWWGRAGPHPH